MRNGEVYVFSGRLAPSGRSVPQRKTGAGFSIESRHGGRAHDPLHNYASTFGLQWNAYRTTPFVSRTGLAISRERLTRLLGGSLEMVRGKKVVEARARKPLNGEIDYQGVGMAGEIR